MRPVLACLLLAALPAWSQAPATKPAAAPDPTKPVNTVSPKSLPNQRPCNECGVVYTVKVVRKELNKDGPTAATETRPSGLVASIPLPGGPDTGKPQLGSSTRLGSDSVAVSESWEVSIRMDNGSYRLIRLTEEPGVREGDKVRIDAKGQVKLRTD